MRDHPYFLFTKLTDVDIGLLATLLEDNFKADIVLPGYISFYNRMLMEASKLPQKIKKFMYLRLSCSIEKK